MHWLDPVTYPKSVSSIPGEGSGRTFRGEITQEITDDDIHKTWLLELETVYPGKWNKVLSSTFQSPEEGRNVQWLKHCDKHEDNSLKNVSNVLFSKIS